MRRIQRQWGISAIVVLASLSCGEDGPGRIEALPELPPIERPSFDGVRAFAHLEEQVGFGPRVPGTESHAQQLQWMVELVGTLADTVVVDTFTHRTRAGESLTLYNVFASFNPAAERRLLLLAHWDTRPKSDRALDPEQRETPVPGANDGASGVAVLLELARLMNQQPPTVGVDLLFVDGEDYGPEGDDMFLGAKHFAETVPDSYEPEYGVLLDMVGDIDPRFPVEGNSAQMAPQVVQRVWGVAQRMGFAAYFPMEVGAPLGDDHVPLNEAGIPTVDIIDFTYGGPGSPFWHTPNDVPANTSAESLRIVGELVTQLVYMGG